jgi:hypothetical protein
MAVPESRRKKRVFVIMPFTETPARGQADLTEFFETNLKARIEAATGLRHQYIVARSDDSFDITAQIIKDLFVSDVVICDLSGPHANPNVMYELGIRLAMTNKPVILIREGHPGNQRIFDIAGFHTYEYSPHQYRKLEDHIINKLAQFEIGAEVYESPILKVLRTEPTILREVNRKRTKNLLSIFLSEIHGMQLTIMASLDAFFREHEIEWDFNGIPDVLEFFRGNQKRLSELPWNAFVFEPRGMPAINAFLVELPLDGFMSDEMEIQINTLISRFFNAYLANRFTWHEPPLRIIFTFTGESLLMAKVLDGCISLLSDVSDDEERLIERQLWKILSRSNLLDDPLQACPTDIARAIQDESKEASNV